MHGERYAMTLVMLSILVAMVGIASQYPPDARFMPFIVGIPGIGLCLLQLGLDWRNSRPGSSPAAGGEAAAHDAGRPRRELIMWAYFLGLVGGIVLFGFLATLPVFALSFLRHRARAGWGLSIGLTAIATLILYLVFVQGLNVALHPGLVTEYLRDRLQG